MIRALLYGAVLTVLLSSAATAQNYALFERSLSAPPMISASQDSFLRLNEDSLIHAQVGNADTTVLPPKSTTIATLGSMVLPGSGQIYTESYWKAPVVWGFLYYFGSVYRHQNSLYRSERDQYETTLTLYANNTDSTKIRSLQDKIDDHKSNRDFYKNQRNLFGWYFAMAYLLNVLDAYVDAALYNFEVSPNLQGTHDVRMSVRVPIGR